MNPPPMAPWAAQELLRLRSQNALLRRQVVDLQTQLRAAQDFMAFANRINTRVDGLECQLASSLAQIRAKAQNSKPERKKRLGRRPRIEEEPSEPPKVKKQRTSQDLTPINLIRTPEEIEALLKKYKHSKARVRLFGQQQQKEDGKEDSSSSSEEMKSPFVFSPIQSLEKSREELEPAELKEEVVKIEGNGEEEGEGQQIGKSQEEKSKIAKEENLKIEESSDTQQQQSLHPIPSTRLY